MSPGSRLTADQQADKHEQWRTGDAGLLPCTCRGRGGGPARVGGRVGAGTSASPLERERPPALNLGPRDLCRVGSPDRHRCPTRGRRIEWVVWSERPARLPAPGVDGPADQHLLHYPGPGELADAFRFLVAVVMISGLGCLGRGRRGGGWQGRVQSGKARVQRLSRRLSRALPDGDEKPAASNRQASPAAETLPAFEPAWHVRPGSTADSRGPASPPIDAGPLRDARRHPALLIVASVHRQGFPGFAARRSLALAALTGPAPSPPLPPCRRQGLRWRIVTRPTPSG